MKKILFKENVEETINIKDVELNRPVFAKKNGKICGMVVSERLRNFNWILRLGGRTGSGGYYRTIEECIKDGMKFRYKFYVMKEHGMKRVLLEEDTDKTISLKDVQKNRPIFVKRNGKICGMVVSECFGDGRWIIRTGGELGCSGFHKTLKSCIKDGLSYGFEFFT